MKNSSWKGGKGDVGREYVDACEKYGIKAGIYLGPKNLVAVDKSTYFAGKDGCNSADVVFDLGRNTAFDCLMGQEVIEPGQRTTCWSAECV